MKRIRLSAPLAAAALTFSFTGCASTQDASASPRTLRVASYNVRGVMKCDTGELEWSRRIPRLAATIRSFSPDVLGVQECRRRMGAGIAAALPEYACIGPAIRETDTEEHQGNLIFYRRDRLRLLSERAFWLSDTPGVPFSSHPSSALKRMCVEARFEDVSTGRRFLFLNTHLDHKSDEARLFGARVVLDDAVRPAKARGETVFLVGDMNKRLGEDDDAPDFAAYTPEKTAALAETNAIALFMTEMSDTAALASEPHIGPYRTFRGWKHDAPIIRIDYIFASPAPKVLRHATSLEKIDGFFASDHCPLWTDVEL